MTPTMIPTMYYHQEITPDEETILLAAVPQIPTSADHHISLVRDRITMLAREAMETGYSAQGLMNHVSLFIDKLSDVCEGDDAEQITCQIQGTDEWATLESRIENAWRTSGASGWEIVTESDLADRLQEFTLFMYIETLMAY